MIGFDLRGNVGDRRLACDLMAVWVEAREDLREAFRENRDTKDLAVVLETAQAALHDLGVHVYES